MAGLLNTGTNTIKLAPQYTDPRASILYGAGNSKISDADIKAYATQPGLTSQQILDKALASGVSREQYLRATGADAKNVDAVIKGSGISMEQTVPTFELPEAKATRANYQPAAFVPAVQDPIKGTVAGQLNTVLDPNSPLMKRAATFALQQKNARGLLNTGGAISAAQAAMTDAGLQIATPDAAANNNFSLYNAGEQNQSNRFNSQLGAQVDMFNAGNATDISKTNAGNATNLIQSREQNATSIMNNNSTLANNFAIANLDVDTKRMIAGIQARSEDSRYAASLYDTFIKLQDNLMRDPNIPADDKSRILGEYADTLNASMGIFDTIQATGISKQLQSFKTSDTGNNTAGQTSNTTQGVDQQAKNGIFYNQNNQIIELSKAKYFEELNNKYGTNISPKQLLSKDEAEVANKSGKTLSQLGIAEYMVPDKYGKASPTGLFYFV